MISRQKYWAAHKNRAKEQREKNKEIYITCKCGQKMSMNNSMKRHVETSTQHANYLKSLETIYEIVYESD